jgi:Protein of unknown function (DUF2726)
MDDSGGIVNWKAGTEPLAGEPLSDDPWPVAARRLLTEREGSLYQSLVTLYPDHKLFIQVALSQLIDVDRKHPQSESIRARYKQLVADFVLCRADLSIVAVIELDDPTHEWPKRQEADARKNKVLADAGIRLIRIPAGRLPSENELDTLIDASKKDRPSPVEEMVLTLAEDSYSSESSYATEEESSEVSQEFKRVALKGLVLIALVGGGWLFISYLLPTLMHRAFQPLAVQAARTAAAPKQSSFVPRQTAAPPVMAQPAANDVMDSSKSRLQEAAALQKQKQAAWAVLYSAPASCEHPADWRAQVECGNQYMRAKKLFEQRWEAEHANHGSAAEVVLDNSSAGGSHR